jgi:ferredoxin
MSAIEAVGTRMKHYPEKCTDCGLCVKICPANVICMYKGIKSEDKLPPEAKRGE